MNSIKELRDICQETRESELYQMDWVARKILRRISIYLTKLCLRLNISANQVTLVSFLVAVAAGVFFTFANPLYWFVGTLLFFFYMVIDCVDGEVSRYKRAKGKEPASPFGVGAFLDGIVGSVTWPYLFVCMTFGIYNTINSTIVFVFGFLATVLRVIYMDIPVMSYPVLHERGILDKAVREAEGSRLEEAKVLKLGRALFGVRGFLPAILIVITIDCFLPPFAVGSVDINARFIYLIIFALAAGSGVIVRVVDVFRHGVRLQRY
jgi:hypothetical protein